MADTPYDYSMFKEVPQPSQNATATAVPPIDYSAFKEVPQQSAVPSDQAWEALQTRAAKTQPDLNYSDPLPLNTRVAVTPGMDPATRNMWLDKQQANYALQQVQNVQQNLQGALGEMNMPARILAKGYMNTAGFVGNIGEKLLGNDEYSRANNTFRNATSGAFQELYAWKR